MNNHRHHLFPISFPKELGKLPLSIKIASLVMFVYFMSWGIANPFINIYLKDVVGTYSGLGFLTLLLYIIPIIWTIPLGQILDRIPKITILRIIFIGYIPLIFWLYYINSLGSAVVWRIYHTVLASILWLLFIDYVREKSPKRKTAEAFGLFGTANTAAAALGAFISGILFTFMGNNMFLVMNIFFISAFLVSSFFPKQKTKKFSWKLIKKDLKDPFKKPLVDFFANKKMVVYSTLLMFLEFVYVLILTLLSLYLKSLNASFLMIGVIYGIFYIPRISEAFFSTIADKYGRKKMIKKGLLIGTICFVLMLLTQNLWFIGLLVFLMSFGLSMIAPAINGKITSSISRRKDIGEMTAVSKSVAGIGGGLGPLIAGIVSDIFGLRYIFLICAVIFGGLFMFYNIFTKRSQLPLDSSKRTNLK